MTALFAPTLAASFEGLIFFVYDREAVKKEADPPENAIVYFYPPSASIEDRISICGQLVGMSHFMHGFLSARPALCKLQTEKVATVHSGQYTLALGGDLSEPDSLLIRQLETLNSIFTFYHGSLERIRMMCESRKIFLTWMNVIWDCYLHFVRHYGDFLPGVFDPLPFLDLPKRVAATCFTKASYILQACQRRQHILGGCILYSNSILCTQLEPSITERLLLLKPNQSNHPARPVKTEHDLPFGVRILNAFLTLSEYLNLYDALAESAYRQPSLSESPTTFPDLYMTSSTSAGNRDSSRKQNDASVEKHLGDNLQQVSRDISSNSGEGVRSTVRENNSTESSAEDVASATPLDTADGVKVQAEKPCSNGDSNVVVQEESKSQNQTKTESDAPLDAKPSSVEQTDGHDVNGDRTANGGGEIILNGVEEQNGGESCVAEKRAEEESKNINGDSEIKATNSTAAFDSSSSESGLSNDVSLTMEPVDVTGLKVIGCSSPQCQGQHCDEEKGETKPTTSCAGTNCTTSESAENDYTDICGLVLEDLLTKVVAVIEEESSSLENKINESVVGLGACCQACADAKKSRDFSCGSAKPCESEEAGYKVESNESLTNENSRSVEDDHETETVDIPPGIQETIPQKSDSNDGEEAGYSRSSKTADVAENSLPIDVNSSKDNSLRTELLKTPIVCDSFSIRNLNVGSEKFLEKSFARVDTSIDTEIEQLQTRMPVAEVNASTLNANASTEAVDGISLTASFFSVESDSGTYVANGHEGVSSSEGIEVPVDSEEVEEEDESPEWFEPPLGGFHSSSLPDLEGEEKLLFEEEGGGDGVNQVGGLTHVNLYVQAHSKVVLILLAEEGLDSDSNSIKALWETSLSQLGELEFLVKQSLGDESIPVHSDEYSFLVYDSFERNMRGNLDELVYQVDHSFCETTKVLHEQFENCSTLKDVTLRSRSSTVYGKNNLGRGTYFHMKGSSKTMQGVPSPRDPILKLRRRAMKVLHKEHGVNVF